MEGESEGAGKEESNLHNPEFIEKELISTNSKDVESQLASKEGSNLAINPDSSLPQSETVKGSLNVEIEEPSPHFSPVIFPLHKDAIVSNDVGHDPIQPPDYTSEVIITSETSSPNGNMNTFVPVDSSVSVPSSVQENVSINEVVDSSNQNAPLPIHSSKTSSESINNNEAPDDESEKENSPKKKKQKSKKRKTSHRLSYGPGQTGEWIDEILAEFATDNPSSSAQQADLIHELDQTVHDQRANMDSDKQEKGQIGLDQPQQSENQEGTIQPQIVVEISKKRPAQVESEEVISENSRKMPRVSSKSRKVARWNKSPDDPDTDADWKPGSVSKRATKQKKDESPHELPVRKSGRTSSMEKLKKVEVSTNQSVSEPIKLTTNEEETPTVQTPVKIASNRADTIIPMEKKKSMRRKKKSSVDSSSDDDTFVRKEKPQTRKETSSVVKKPMKITTSKEATVPSFDRNKSPMRKEVPVKDSSSRGDGNFQKEKPPTIKEKKVKVAPGTSRKTNLIEPEMKPLTRKKKIINDSSSDNDGDLHKKKPENTKASITKQKSLKVASGKPEPTPSMDQKKSMTKKKKSSVDSPTDDEEYARKERSKSRKKATTKTIDSSDELQSDAVFEDTAPVNPIPATSYSVRNNTVKRKRCSYSSIEESEDDNQMMPQESDASNDDVNQSRSKRLAKLNKRTSGRPKRDVTIRVKGKYEVVCDECAIPTYHKDANSLRIHWNDVHKTCHCAFCNEELKLPQLKNHLAKNHCLHMPRNLMIMSPEMRKRSCEKKSCTFKTTRWEDLRKHILATHEDLNADFHYCKTDPSQGTYSKTPQLQPVKPCSYKSFKSTSMKNKAKQGRTPIAEYDDSLMNIMQNLDLKLVPDGARIEPIKTECNLPGFVGVQKIFLEEMGIFDTFPNFVSFFHKSGLAESGAIVVHFKHLKDSNDNNPQFYEKLKSAKMSTVLKQSIIKSYSDGRIHQISYDDMYTDISIHQFAQNETRAGLGTDHDIAMEVMDNLPKLMKKVKNEYGSDIDFSLFAHNHKGWNLNFLDNDLANDNLFSFTCNDGNTISVQGPGIRTPYIYVGKYRTIFTLHKEDSSIHSISYLHYGATKVWYIFRPEDAWRIEEKIHEVCSDQSSKCAAFLRHKQMFVHPSVFDEWEIPYSTVYQRPGEYVVLAGGAYHQGVNLGFNCAEAVNFITAETMKQYKMDYYECYCDDDPMLLPRNKLVGRHEPDRYENFIRGEDMDYVPGKETLTKALNDFDRIKAYMKNHFIWREKNGNVNPKTGAIYNKMSLKYIKQFQSLDLTEGGESFVDWAKSVMEISKDVISEDDSDTETISNQSEEMPDDPTHHSGTQTSSDTLQSTIYIPSVEEPSKKHKK